MATVFIKRGNLYVGRRLTAAVSYCFKDRLSKEKTKTFFA